MRNLKKILAMALALVMSLSLMATAGAAETTAANNAATLYKTAADVLVGLGIVKGDLEDPGNYRFNDPIIRAEAAALIYRVHTADVNDDQAGLHTNSPFTDLAPVQSWATGYISYAHNAEIVKGNGDGTFSPLNNITGYETLAMTLRAMGYGKNGEFTGPEWEINTASWAQRIGLLNGVSAADQVSMGQPATRALVFQIMFNAMLLDEVKFSALNPYNYDSMNTTLGLRNFGLEKITGVVMANEWANLNEDDNGGDSVLKSGVTELKLADGTVRTLDSVVSEDPAEALDAVGLTYNAYISNGEGSVKKTLTLEKSDINVVAFNDGKSVATGELDEGFSDLDALAKTESVKIGSKSEYFVDYAQSWNEDCKSDYLIRYAIAKAYIDGGNLYKDGSGPSMSAASQVWKDQMAAWVADGTATTRDINVKVNSSDKVVECYLRTIRIGKDITKIDQDIMYEIFDKADRTGDNTTADASEVRDYALGEVYVGTTSMKDYSDELSWKAFRAEYFIDSKNSRTFEGAENGESVRIVDNNGDGTAEYVLKITYNLDQALETYKDVLVYNRLNLRSSSISEVYYGSEVAVDDVVIWNVIDGKASIWLAETDTDKIETKNFRNITVTTESDATYGQSGIYNWTGMDQLIMNMNSGTDYIMYKDRFGFVRAYALAQGTQYALLTEMYPTNGQNWNYVNTSKAIAEVKIGDEAVTEYEVADGTKNVFFSDYAWTSRDLYFNTNYNYLQPAIAHLGNPNNTPGYFDGKVKMSGNTPDAKYIEWNRKISEMDANENGDYGVFDYGAIAYAAAGGTTGPAAVSGGAGTADHSFSFTNVGTYALNDDVVSLGSASKLAITANGEQIYYVASSIGLDGTKTWQSKWIADQKANNSTRSEAQLATDFQDLVKGTNVGGENDGNTIGFYPVYAVDYVHLDAQDVAAGTRHYRINDSYNTKYNASSNGYVDATVNTEFYIVMAGNILHKVGYDELPSIDADSIRAAYAVAKNTTKAEDGYDYWVANVIVLEVDGLNKAYQSISLMYYNPWETVTSGIRYVQSLNNEWTALQPDYDDQAKMNIVPATVSESSASANWGNSSWRGSDYGFYALYDTELETEGTLEAGNVTKITGDWNDHGIYAGTVQRIKGILNSSGYIDVDLKGRDHTEGTQIKDEWVKHLTVRNVPIYRVTTTDAGTLTISEIEGINEVNLGDELIWVYNVAQKQISYIVDLGDRYSSTGKLTYSAADWLKDTYKNGTTGIIDEQTNTTVAPSYDWTVTVNMVNVANNEVISTKTYGVANNGTVAIPATDLNLAGWTLGTVKNVTAEPAETLSGTGGYYLLQNITSDITVTAEQTADALDLSLSFTSGTVTVSVNGSNPANYTTGCEVGSDGTVAPNTTAGQKDVYYGDTYTFVISGLNNVQYDYTVTGATGFETSWNGTDDTLTISGTVGGSDVDLILSETSKTTNTIVLGTHTGTTIQITSKDNTGAPVGADTGATVLLNSAVTFTVTPTAPATSEVETVTYTVLGEDPVPLDAESGIYTIPADVVAGGLPITIEATIKSTAPITVSLTKDSTPNLFVSTDGTSWAAAGVSATINPGETLYLRSAGKVVVTRSSGTSGTIAGDPVGSHTNFKVTGITDAITLTISDPGDPNDLTVTVAPTGGAVTLPTTATAGNGIWYCIIPAADADDASDEIDTWNVLTTKDEIENALNTQLIASSTAPGNLSDSDNDSLVVAVELDGDGILVGVGSCVVSVNP